MKFRYLAGLLVALSFNTGFAADAGIAAGNYQGIYEAFTRRSVADINAALRNNQDFDHNADPDAIRRSAAGLALRTAVIGLGFDDLKAVVEENHAFFKTSLGVSLLHGWALNQFKDAITPYCIDTYFSFKKMFQGLATRVGAILGAGDAGLGATAKTFFQSAFTRGLAAVEAERWKFYDHMLYLPYAIGQVRVAVLAVDGAVVAPLPSIDMVIANATRSAMEARTEAANLVSAKAGRTVHLDVIPAPAAVDSLDCADLSMVQKCMLQRPELFAEFTQPEKETLLSLPADALSTYNFLRGTVRAYIEAAQRMTQTTRAVVVARQTARTQSTFFTHGRRAKIVKILADLNGSDHFLKAEALKDAYAIVSDPRFLANDQESNPASFPDKMVGGEVDVGLDAYLVKVLAIHVRKSSAFMLGDLRCTTVIGYADDQDLKGLFGNYRPQRAPIAQVRDALIASFPRA